MLQCTFMFFFENIEKFFYQSIQLMTDFLLPHICPCCHSIIQSPGLCASCWKSITFLTDPLCQLCGDRMMVSNENICRICLDAPPFFNSHSAIFQYGPLPRKLIFGLKYGRQRHLLPFLATLALPLVLRKNPDYIIPVPLHKSKLASRGLNQAAVLGQYISIYSGIKMLPCTLIRPFKGKSQGYQTAMQRRENVENAFSCQGASMIKLHDARLLIIDDVYTTGATLNACSLALRQAGARHIHCITLAKVIF